MGNVPMKKVANADAGDADHVGGNDWDDFVDFLDDVDKTGPVRLNTETRVRSGKFKFRDTGNNHNYTHVFSDLAADINVTWPLLTGNDQVTFDAHTTTLTNKTIDQISNPIKQQNAYKYVVFIDAADSNRIKCIDQDSGAIVSNNTSALTTLQYAVDNAGGKPIFVKRGTYVLTAELNCVDKHVYIVGESINASAASAATVLQKAGTGNIVSCDNVSTTMYESLYLKDLYINGVDRLGTGLRVDKVKHCFPMLDHVKIQNCATGIHITESWYDNFISLWVENCNKGVWIENNSVGGTQLGGGNTLYFYGGKIQGCHTNNLHVDVCNDASFFGTIFESDDTHIANPVIKLDSESEYTRFYDCSFENYNGNIVIVHDEGRSSRFVNCRFQQTITDLNITSYEAVGARSCSLIGNTFGFSGNGGTGILTISIDSACQDMSVIANTKRRWVEPNNLTFTDTGTRTTRIGNTFCDDRIANTITTAGTLTTGGNLTTDAGFISKGFIRFENDISPSQITSDQNDYNPTGLSTASRIRLDADSSFRTITGLQGGADGRILWLTNISANTILLANQNTGSSAANRFDFGGYDIPLFPSQAVQIKYDSTATRWRVVNGQAGIILPVSSLGYHIYHDMYNTNGEAAFTTASGGTLTAVSSLSNHPGILNWTMGTSTTGSGGFRVSSTVNSLLLGNSNYYRYDIIFRITTLSDGTNTYTLRAGFMDSVSAESTDGAFFRYTHSVNSGKWELVARSNSTETVTNATNTAVAAATWYRLTVIVNPAGNKAEYFQDGVSLGTVTSNIPTGAGRNCTAGIMFLKSAGTTDTTIMDVDSSGLLYYFNTSR